MAGGGSTIDVEEEVVLFRYENTTFTPQSDDSSDEYVYEDDRPRAAASRPAGQDQSVQEKKAAVGENKVVKQRRKLTKINKSQYDNNAVVAVDDFHVSLREEARLIRARQGKEEIDTANLEDDWQHMEAERKRWVAREVAAKVDKARREELVLNAVQSAYTDLFMV